jgi:FkbM family methyltransferase
MEQIDRWLGNFAVPARDNNNVRHRRIEQGDTAMARLKKMFPDGGIALQAGANWGYWPARMALIFDRVYTFEPDPACFVCTCANTANFENVYRYQAALGNGPAFIDLKRDTDTTGNQIVDGKGPLPTLRIDDFGFEELDLIYLDIEGQELNALKGALETLERCKPVVIYEERQAFKHNDEIPVMLFEYEKAGAIGADQILRHKAKR